MYIHCFSCLIHLELPKIKVKILLEWQFGISDRIIINFENYPANLHGYKTHLGDSTSKFSLILINSQTNLNCFEISICSTLIVKYF